VKKVPLLLLVLVLILPFTEVRCTFGSSAKAETVFREVMPPVSMPEGTPGVSFPHFQRFRSGDPGRPLRHVA
jgi:hypothetical protein